MKPIVWGVPITNFYCFPGGVETLDADWIERRAIWDRWKDANRDKLAAQSVSSLRIAEGLKAADPAAVADVDAQPREFLFEIVYNPGGDGRYRVTCGGRVIDQGESTPI